MAHRNASEGGQGGGCLALLLLLLVVGAIVAAVISLAALVDPFDWMPPVGEIWEDCEGDCALAHRFPGFWWHAAANLLYAVAAAAVACGFVATVVELREKRAARYDSTKDADAFSAARDACLGAGAILGALALLPIVVAIA
jgi:hypothetical protein